MKGRFDKKGREEEKGQITPQPESKTELSFNEEQGAPAGLPMFLQSSDLPSTGSGLIQRKINKKEKLTHPEGELQSDAGTGGTHFTLSPGNALRGTGQPLPEAERKRFEHLFDTDLGHVRLHTDGEAAKSAEGIDAQAYTVGRDVVFGSEKYAPETSAGQHLLAHELTHVVQQRRSGAPSIAQASLEVSDPADASEREADEAAERAEAGESVEVSAAPSAGIARQTPLQGQIPTSGTGPARGSVEDSVREFKQTVAEMAVYRLAQNVRAVDAWKSFLENSLRLDQLRPQTTALEATQLYRNVSHAQSHGPGGMEAGLYEQWATTRNPYMRIVQEHQLRGEWRACTGCHMTNWAYGRTPEPGSPNWMTPREQLTGSSGMGGQHGPTTLSQSDVASITRYVQGLPNSSAATTSSASNTSPSSSTSPTSSTSSTTTSTSAATPASTNASDVSRYFGTGDLYPTMYPATADVIQAVTRIRPFLEQLGPQGYQVLPPETINSDASPAELLADIAARIEQRKADYRELIDKIQAGDVDPMTFEPVVAWLLPLADAEVLQALQAERESAETWETVKAIIIGVTAIALLVISIAFPPAAILAAGVTAGEVVAAGTLGLSLWQFGSGVADLAQGYELNQNMSLATGTHDVFYPEQQRQADAMMMSGVVNIALSLLGLRGSLASFSQLAEAEAMAGSGLIQPGSSGRFTPYAGQTIQRGPWTMTVSEDGVMAVATHADDAALIAIADAEGVGMYRLLPSGERVTVGYQSFSSATGAAGAGESAWTESVVIPNRTPRLLSAGGTSGSSLSTAAEPGSWMVPQGPILPYSVAGQEFPAVTPLGSPYFPGSLSLPGATSPLLLSAPNLSIGGRLSMQSLAQIEAEYGVAVRNMTAAARTQQDLDAIGMGLGGQRNKFLADVTELLTVDIRNASGTQFAVRPHSGGTIPGVDVFSVTAEGTPRLMSVEVKAGMSANPYQVGASGMPNAYRSMAELYEEIYRVIRDPNLPIRLRSRMKLALDEGNITWELDAYGNVRITARGSNAMPGNVSVNRPVPVGR